MCPLRNFQPDLAIDLGYLAKDVLGSDDTIKTIIQTTIQSNFAKAEIYYQTLNVQSIEEKRKYSVRYECIKCLLLWLPVSNIIVCRSD